jgi:glycosyltransferase involved in cell wall biosynthesis
MKFAIIAGFYKYGSTGKGVHKNYTRIINLGYDVKVFYGKKKQETDNEDIVYFGNRLFYYFSVIFGRISGLSDVLSNFTTSKLIHHLKKYKPDVVWLSGIHGYYINWYRLIKFLKKNNIWTVYGMTDEFAFTGKCCSAFDCEKYKTGCHHCPHLKNYPESRIFDNSKFVFNLKKKAYAGWDKVVFRSAPYVVNKARESYLLKDKEMFAGDSSVDIERVYYPRDPGELRKKLGIADNQKVAMLCAPSTDPHKGSEYFVECARLCEKDDIVFIQVAFNGDESSLPSNFIPISYVGDPNELAEYYSLADVYVCTSLSDAQPNTCLEAMGCGTPIAGFNVSGVPYVAPEEFGTFVEPKNAEALAQVIRDIPRKTDESIEKCHVYAKNRFSIEASNGRHAEFVNEMCERVRKDKGI